MFLWKNTFASNTSIKSQIEECDDHSVDLQNPDKDSSIKNGLILLDFDFDKKIELESEVYINLSMQNVRILTFRPIVDLRSVLELKESIRKVREK